MRGSAAILLVALGLAACGGDAETGATAVSTTTTETMNATSTSEPVARTVAVKVLRRESTNPAGMAVLVEFSYPQLRGAAEPAAEELANAAIEAEVTAEADAFEARAADVDLPPESGTGVLEAHGEHEVVAFTDDLVSIRLSFDEHLGGAHGIQPVRTVNLDLGTGDRIELEDMFDPATSWTETLATAAREALRVHPALDAMADDAIADMVEAGTAPDPANFSAFTLPGDGLEVTFQNYQVGPYAIGTPSVTIPAAALDAVLAPRGKILVDRG